MMFYKIIVVSAYIFISFLLSCGNDTVAGGGTETGNALSGNLVDQMSRPIASARVTITPENASSAHSNSYTRTTDVHGSYEFNNIEARCYTLEARAKVGTDSIFAIHYSLCVGEDDSIDAGTDTLRPGGHIFGNVQKPDTNDHSGIIIYIPGTSYLAISDTDGSFNITNIPEDTVSGYRLGILDVGNIYSSPFIDGIKVWSGLTDSITNPIKLSSIKIPTVSGFILSYDSLNQFVTLNWNKYDTSSIKGCNIYRKHLDSAQVLLTGSDPIKDTFYIDSTCIQDETYIYYASFVDIKDEIGDKTSGDTVIITSAFRVVRDIIKPIWHQSMALKSNPKSRIYSYGEGDSIYIYDSLGNYTNSLKPTRVPNDMETDSNGNLYTIYWGDQKVKVWDINDTLVSEWSFSEFFDYNYLSTPSPELIVLDSTFAFIFDDVQVVKYALSGTYINKYLLGPGQGFKEVKSQDSVFIFDSLSQCFHIYDKDWNNYSQIYLNLLTPEMSIENCSFLSDSIMVLETTPFQDMIWMGSYLSIINIQNGSTVARFGSNYMKMGITDFKIGPDKRIYVLRNGDKFTIYEYFGSY